MLNNNLFSLSNGTPKQKYFVSSQFSSVFQMSFCCFCHLVCVSIFEVYLNPSYSMKTLVMPYPVDKFSKLQIKYGNRVNVFHSNDHYSRVTVKSMSYYLLLVKHGFWTGMYAWFEGIRRKHMQFTFFRLFSCRCSFSTNWLCLITSLFCFTFKTRNIKTSNFYAHGT